MITSRPMPETDAPAPRDARLTTILLVGRVWTDTHDYLCRVRNISAGGMRIETLAPVAIGEPIRVELKNGAMVKAQVVWIREAEAGVQFAEPVDIEQVLAPTLPQQRSGRVQRSPRLAARVPVALRRDGHILSGVLIDVSQGGAQVQANGATRVGDLIVLFVPGLGGRRAVVRWNSGGVVGLSFAEKIGFAELAEWLAGPERFASEPVVVAETLATEPVIRFQQSS